MTFKEAYYDAYKKGLLNTHEDWLEQAIISCPQKVGIDLAVTEAVKLENLDCCQPVYKRSRN